MKGHLLLLEASALLVVLGVQQAKSEHSHTFSKDSQLEDNPGFQMFTFDYGWRFQLGDASGSTNTTCPASEFPKNLTGVEISGLHRSDAQTLETCRGACCLDPTCEVWQWAGTPDEHQLGCWIGQMGPMHHNSPRWQSGGRDISPGPRPTAPPATSGPTSRGYNDSSWALVDAPHDGIIGGVYSQDASGSHGYLPFNITWYRKHFNLPAEWKGQSAISVYFEGVFKSSTVYLNGMALVSHASGYTSFVARLDNASTLLYGDGPENENVLAVMATASGGSGWWYEGGGIYRRTFLGRTPTQVHFVADGLYAMSNVTGKITAHRESDPASGMVASEAAMDPRVEVVHDGAAGGKAGPFTVVFRIRNSEGEVLGSTVTNQFELAPGETLLAGGPELVLTDVELWSSARPYMHSLETVMMNGDIIIDNITKTMFGVRRAQWTADEGFFLNDQPFKWRGFCDHNDFSGIGTALSERLHLFRAQSLRSVGGNSWRMSHNPPAPPLLDTLDALGVMVWDENRNLGNETEYIDAQRDMVKRDRNHPSVMCWSFCNEGGCDKSAAIGAIFKRVSYEQDPMRPVTANTQQYGPGDLSDVLDVQGFSHRPGSMFDSFHAKYPSIPTIGSECCSCRTQRGEDVANSSGKLFGNFNGDCLQSQTGVEMSRKFVSGILVWTLFDYYGEPTPYNWPHVSSSFGSLDLAGFAKAGASYYRAWWLLNSTNMSASVHDQVHRAPILPDSRMASQSDGLKTGDAQFMTHIVEHWQKDMGGQSRSVHAYTNAPMAELFVNGKSYGRVSVSWIGYAAWDKVTYADGNLTVTGLNAAGQVVASHTIMTPGAAASLQISLDAPNTQAGMGDALVLDGHDMALVRASILDSNGQVVMASGHNVTFTVDSGPGRVIGVGNGDPMCHEPNTVNWRSSYHGLVRAIVKVTEHQTTSEAEYRFLKQVDAEGNIRTRIRAPWEPQHALEGIQVTAHAMLNGKQLQVSITIPVSTDFDRHSPQAVARRWMMDKEDRGK
ncbi:beta-galactosidase BoGH2A-like [Sycon ciliatum]|uniref:beta-galactosidase BoGH2A-like n=1 Tax=Sycon ciliatum TaxID=27933 RepID=UPI0031F5F278